MHEPESLEGQRSHSPATPVANTSEGNGRIVDVERRGSQTTEQKEDKEIPQLSLPVTLILLVVDTVLVAITADWLVDSINGLTSTGVISQEWVGLILLPIVGNAAEHVTAVTVSVKDKLTLSLGVAVGSSIVRHPSFCLQTCL